MVRVRLVSESTVPFQSLPWQFVQPVRRELDSWVLESQVVVIGCKPCGPPVYWAAVELGGVTAWQAKHSASTPSWPCRASGLGVVIGLARVFGVGRTVTSLAFQPTVALRCAVE